MAAGSSAAWASIKSLSCMVSKVRAMSASSCKHDANAFQPCPRSLGCNTDSARTTASPRSVCVTSPVW
eukprot:7361246-Pyramimonas_sp.AAC.1